MHTLLALAVILINAQVSLPATEITSGPNELTREDGADRVELEVLLGDTTEAQLSRDAITARATQEVPEPAAAAVAGPAVEERQRGADPPQAAEAETAASNLDAAAEAAVSELGEEVAAEAESAGEAKVTATEVEEEDAVVEADVVEAEAAEEAEGMGAKVVDETEAEEEEAVTEAADPGDPQTDAVERRRQRVARRLSHAATAPADGCSGANPGACTPYAAAHHTHECTWWRAHQTSWL